MNLDLTEIQKLVDDKLELITIDGKALAESKERAANFLVTVALLANIKRDLEIEKAKKMTISECSFAQAVDDADGKNITEKKAKASQSKPYTDAREELEELDAIIKWVRTHITVFEHAHLTYRQLSNSHN